MPYCERHDEVYRAAECPVCAAEDDDGETADTGRQTGNDPSAGVDVDVSVDADGVAGAADDADADVESDPLGGRSTDEVVADALDGVDAGAVDGDVVVGDQHKRVEDMDVTRVDESTTVVDESTTEIDESTTVVDESVEKTDESTTVEDSVVSRSDVGGDGEGATVEDSVVSRSDVGGKAEPRDAASEPPGAEGDQAETTEESETQFCTRCGVEVQAGARACPSCGKRLE